LIGFKLVRVVSQDASAMISDVELHAGDLERARSSERDDPYHNLLGVSKLCIHKCCCSWKCNKVRIRQALKVRIHGAFNVGCSQTEIIEVIVEMVLYAGFPAVLNGLSVAKKVFDERRKK
jgi:hypothetical protein